MIRKGARTVTTPKMMAGICHTMQSGVVEVAFRHVGSIRDFSGDPSRLLRG